MYWSKSFVDMQIILIVIKSSILAIGLQRSWDQFNYPVD